MFLPADHRFLSSLAPPDPHWGGTGSLPLPVDTRDYPFSLLPGFAAAREALPGAVDLSANVQEILNQGAEPSCFPAGTLIRLADGSHRPIESIRLLDEVLTAEGRTGKVVVTMVKQTASPLVQVKLRGHQHLVTTPEHPILTERGYVAAGDLTPDDFVALPRYLPENRQEIRPNEYLTAGTQGRAIREGRKRFDTRWGQRVEVVVDDVPETISLDYDFGRIVGLFLAEGSSRRDVMVWTFGKHEAKTLAQELTILLRDRLGLTPLIQPRPNSTVNIVVYGRHWRQLFEALCATGSGSKRLHPHLCEGPQEFLKGVLEGWLDGDGHRNSDGRTTGVTISHELALQMYDVAQALGLRPTIRRSDPPPNAYARSRRERWDVVFSAGERPEIGSRQTESHVWRKVHSLELVPLDEPAWVYNLQVEGDNSYVAEGVGVHNCVAFSTCGLTATFDWMADHGYDSPDGHRLYREMGGDGRNGVDTRATLDRARTEGVPLLSGAARLKIGSYVFASRQPGQFRQDLAAALSLGNFCTIALLLPSSFGGTSSGAITSGYHQVYATGFTGLGDSDFVIICNSWGKNWGQNGFGRIPWGFIEQSNLQNGYAYAYTVTPLVLPNPNPTPTPTPTPTPEPAPQPDDFAAEVFRLLNAERAKANLAPLAGHPALGESARSFALWMGTNNRYGHDADGRSPLDRMRAAGLTGETHWGENIAAGQTNPAAAGTGNPIYQASAIRDGAVIGTEQSFLLLDRERETPAGVFGAWMQSEGHRANILFPSFTHVGIGYANVPGSQYVHYWVQNFAALSGGPTPDPNPEPNPGPNPPSSVEFIGKATGGGLEMIQKGNSLAASGGGFQGTVEVLERRGTPSPEPTPEPEPEPGPDPSPDPAGFAVTAQIRRAGRLLQALVTVTGPEPGTAGIVASVEGRLIGRGLAGINGAPTVLSLQNQARGTAVTFAARSGERTATTTEAVP